MITKLFTTLFDASGLEQQPPQFGSFTFSKAAVESGMGTDMPDYLWSSMDARSDEPKQE
eukprot:CAMPEP_0206240196 /NCGR_PEP_ID=MMETSP0047_2-20121206/15807_1 /ASSEMBLY_ACC=CAM_ASM_000192 /TAXON_ID=195065 /ORGANISM="Chroomonas mesostigmatica_cf, Strain CCMP1168" /LENGTH=58 /DNA_ID=CAMNT_0053664957 /DNA_START=24 /DNA_END=200 /DNA_ORIENTATION=+